MGNASRSLVDRRGISQRRVWPMRRLTVGLAVKPVGEPDAGNRHVRVASRSVVGFMDNTTASIVENGSKDIRKGLEDHFGLRDRASPRASGSIRAIQSVGLGKSMFWLRLQRR
jgi:hypothetical protein